MRVKKKRKRRKGGGPDPNIMVLGCAGIMLMVAATTTNGRLISMVLAMMLMGCGAAIGAIITGIRKAIRERNRRDEQ